MGPVSTEKKKRVEAWVLPMGPERKKAALNGISLRINRFRVREDDIGERHNYNL